MNENVPVEVNCMYEPWAVSVAREFADVLFLTGRTERELSIPEQRGAVFRATIKWVVRNTINAARRGFASYGRGMPVYDRWRKA